MLTPHQRKRQRNEERCPCLMKRWSKRIGRRERRIIFKRKQIFICKTACDKKKGGATVGVLSVGCSLHQWKLCNCDGPFRQRSPTTSYPKNRKVIKYRKSPQKYRNRDFQIFIKTDETQMKQSSRMWLKQLYSHVIVIGLLASNLFLVGWSHLIDRLFGFHKQIPSKSKWVFKLQII